MKRYAAGLFLFSIFIIVFGFISGKITTESFQYISLSGLLFAILKALIVVLILLLALAATIPIFFIDLVLLFFTSYNFAIVGNLWAICWKGVTIGWFWTETSGSSLFFGALILLLISSLLYRRRRW
jgi:hypothetical protein